MNCPPLENVTEAEPGEEPVVSEPSLLPVILDRSLLEWQRVTVTSELKAVKCIFDHYTGGSDRQRGYCNCLQHPKCFRWRFCDEFDCRDAFAAYMLSWAVSGEHLPSRVEHMGGFEPDPEYIAVVRATMELSEF